MGSVWSGDRELQQLFKTMQEQAPQATARALTGLAFDVRKETQEALPKWIKLTRPFLQQSVIYVPARSNRLVSEVGFHTRAGNIPALLEYGGTRTPKGKAFALPTDEVRRTGKGNILNSQRPRAVLQRKNTFSGVPENAQGARAGIWQTVRKTALRLLYAFVPRTRYKGGDIQFRKLAERVYYKNAEGRMRDAISHMLGRSKAK